MSSILTVICIIGLIIPFSILNIFLYSISKKISFHFSNVVVKYCSSILFALLSTYKKFKCIKYSDYKDALPSQFLVISNHQSLLDIPLFFEFFREKKVRFVAKEELGRYVPIISEVLRSQEHALIPRNGSPSAMMKVLDSFAQRVIERHWIPIIFPEGTRSKNGQVGNFYAAGFRRMLNKAPMPVVVCALEGGYKFSTLGAFLRKMENGAFQIKILKIYNPPTTKEEQIAILNEGKQLIEKQLEEWRSI